MWTSRKLVCSSLAMLLCAAESGCAGSRLRDMFSTSSPSDYKTLQQMAEEERKLAENGAADSETAVASFESDKPTLRERLTGWSGGKKTDDAVSSDSSENHSAASENPESSSRRNPLSSLLSMGQKPELEADPFLNAADSSADAVKSPAKKPATKTQTEAERLAELDAETSKPDQVVAGREPATTRKSDSAKTSATPEVETTPAEPLIQPGSRKSAGKKLAAAREANRSQRNPADELESLVSRHNAAQAEEIRKRSRETGTTKSSKPRTTEGLTQASAQVGGGAEESYEEMFEALQADFKTGDTASRENDPAEAFAGAEPASYAESASSETAEITVARAASENPFDSFLSGDTGEHAAPAKSAAQPIQQVAKAVPAEEVVSAKSGFDMLLETGDSRPRRNRRAADSSQVIGQLLGADLANSKKNPADRSTPESSDLFAGRDPFSEVGLARAQSLTDVGEFQWKQAADPRETLGNPTATAEQWWGEPANRGAHPGADQRISTAAWNSGEQSDRTHAAGAGRVLHNASASDAPRRLRNPGFEDDPFQTTSFQTTIHQSSPVEAVVSEDSAPVVDPAAQVKRMSFRTWGFLIGCAIVAILLLAPKRNRQLPVSRQSDGR